MFKIKGVYELDPIRFFFNPHPALLDWVEENSMHYWPIRIGGSGTSQVMGGLIDVGL